MNQPLSDQEARGREVSAERPRAGVGSNARSFGALALLTIACLLAFANSWRGEFVSDDVTLYEQVQQGSWTDSFRNDLIDFETGGRSGFYRPLGSLSLRADTALFGAAPAGFHLTNLALHVLATWLVLGLALRFGMTAAPAFGAALLFAVHPVHSEAVAWISGRFDVLCGALYLLALWWFAGAHQRASGWRYGLALASTGAALLAKEMAATLPAAVFLCDALGLSRRERAPRATAHAFWTDSTAGAFLRALPFAALVVAYVVWRSSQPELALGSSIAAAPLSERVLSAGRALFYYLGLLVWPGTPNAVATVTSIRNVSNPWVLAALLLVGGSVWLALRIRRSSPELAFGILFLFASLIPLSNIIALYPTLDSRLQVSERYMYLPSFGFVLVLAGLLWKATHRFGGRVRIAFVATLLVLAGSGIARTQTRNAAWKNNDVLFETSVRADPRNPLAHVQLGVLRRSQARMDEARESFSTALRLEPRSYVAHLELGNVEMSVERYEAAVESYRRAVESRPQGRQAQLGLANALLRLDRLPEAQREYTILLQRNPRDFEALVNQGRVLQLQGQRDAARQHFERASLADPNRKEAVYNLAIDAMQRNDLTAAERFVQRALAMDNSYRDAHMLLGNVKARRGDFQSAVHAFEKAIAADSAYAPAFANLGASYLNLGDYARATVALQQALRLAPSAIAHQNLAEVQVRTGEPAAAEASFRAALRLDGEMAAAQRGLGLLLAGQPGHEAEARRLLEALPADAGADDAEVRSALARLPRRR